MAQTTVKMRQIAGGLDGWIPAEQTWAYASASTITVPSGAASKYQKGDKIKLTQTTVKYFYVVGVVDTVLTVTGGTDYTVANAAITLPFFSKIENPQGFPSVFNSSTTDITFKISTGGDVLLRGWGYKQSANSTAVITATVSFGITFSVAPVVVLGLLGDKPSAGAPSAIGHFTAFDNQFRNAYNITTSQFTFAVVDYATGSTNYWWGFSFIVLGQI